MTNPAFTQVTFRLRNDNGNETGATWKAAEGADATINVNENFRCRFRIDETASRAWTNKNWNLYYSLNAGAYTAAGSGTPVNFSTSTYFTNGDDCTSQLSGGTGTFVTDNNGMIESTGGATNSGTAGYLFEVEFCVQLDGAYVANADTINLRIYDSTSAIAAYTDTPVITASKIAISKTDALTIADTNPTMEMVGPKEINQTDAITVGESHSVAIPNLGVVQVSDAVTLVDTPQVEYPVAARLINVSDTITVGESLGYREDSNPTATDAISLGESLMYFEDSIWLSEALAVAVESGATNYTISVSDAITVGESLLRMLEMNVSKADAISVGESRTVEREAAQDREIQNAVDAIALGESRAVSVPNLGDISKTDAVTIGESLTVQVPQLGAVNVSDVVTVSEVTPPAVTRTDAGQMDVSKSDTVNLGESLAVAVPQLGNVNVSDGITVGESLARSVDNFVNKTDAITVGETLARSVDSFISKTDAINLGESQAFTGDLFVNKSDAITVSEVTPPSVVRVNAGQIDVNKSDAINLNEAFSVAVLQLGGVNVSDGVTLSDSIQRMLDLNRAVTDAVTLGESRTVTIPSLGGVNVSDALSLTDAVTVSIPALGVFSINVTDALTIGESRTVAVPSLGGVNVSDSMTIGESRSIYETTSISVSDGLTLSETVQLVLPLPGICSINVLDSLVLGEVRDQRMSVSLSVSDGLVLGDAGTVYLLGVNALIELFGELQFFTGTLTDNLVFFNGTFIDDFEFSAVVTGDLEV